MKFLITFALFSSMLFAQPTLSPESMEWTIGRVINNPIQLVGSAAIQGASVDETFYFTVNIEKPYDKYTFVQYSGYPTLSRLTSLSVYIDTLSFPNGIHDFNIELTSIFDPSIKAALTVHVELLPGLEYKFAEPNSIVAPHIAIGDVWNTRLVLTNPTVDTSSFEMKFYDSDGEAMNVGLSLPDSDVPETSSYLTSIDPGASTTIAVLPLTEDLQVGSVLFELVDGNSPVVNVEFDNGVDVASVQAQEPFNDNIVIQYNNKFPYATGVAIANSLNEHVHVTLTFYDEFGVNYLTKIVPINANGKSSFMLTDYVETNNRGGFVNLTSDQPTISAFGLVFDVQKNNFYVTAGL